MSPAATEIGARHYAVRATITPEQWAVINREAQARMMGAFTAATTAERLEQIFEAEAKRGLG
jgi:hypothetical protein